MFAIAERIGCSVVRVERMSRREVMGWLAYLSSGDATVQEPVDINSASREELRKAFL
jgi:hypothetical protein